MNPTEIGRTTIPKVDFMSKRCLDWPNQYQVDQIFSRLAVWKPAVYISLEISPAESPNYKKKSKLNTEDGKHIHIDVCNTVDHIGILTR